MKALLLALAVTVSPGTSTLLQGTQQLATHPTTEACINDALARPAGDYTCATTSLVSVSGSSAGACGVPDIGGWSTPVPTPLDTSTVAARDKAQPGSRLYYVSSSTGNDSTGVIYFWNGTHVVDEAGTTYGTDPMNPVGVKAFKRWSWVGPRRSTTNDIGTPGIVGDAWPTFRGGFPDWWLFKRGDVFDLVWDFESFDEEKGQVDSNKYASLNVPGGRSETERQVVGAYGDLCSARPHFIRPNFGFLGRSTRDGHYEFKHTLYQSLHFDAHERVPNHSFQTQFNTMGPGTVDVTIEDVWFDGVGMAIGDHNGGQFRLRRVLITDSYMPANEQHAQGLWWSGTRDGVLRIEDSILLRNGFVHGDPKTLPWPPVPPQTWDVFSRNMYVSGEIDPRASGFFDSVSMLGASGDQWRPGGRIQRSFFYNGYVTLGATGGYPDSEGFTGQVINNVLQRFVGTGTEDNRGQPGWGFGVAAGAGFNYIAGNVVTNAQHAGNHPGMEYAAVNQDCWAEPHHPTRSNKTVANILDTGTATAALRVTDGVPESSCFYDSLAMPGVHSNTMTDNVLISDRLVEHEYKPQGKAPPTTDTVFAGNRMFKTRAEAAQALGWPDPNRTLKTYLQSKGVNVTSPDGFPEYFAKATTMRRGMWNPDWTARPLVNYVRQGFALPPIELPPLPPR